MSLMRLSKKFSRTITFFFCWHALTHTHTRSRCSRWKDCYLKHLAIKFLVGILLKLHAWNFFALQFFAKCLYHSQKTFCNLNFIQSIISTFVVYRPNIFFLYFFVFAKNYCIVAKFSIHEKVFQLADRWCDEVIGDFVAIFSKLLQIFRIADFLK